MSSEIEAAAADGAAGLFRFRRNKAHDLPPGSPCANCGTVLLGPWCYACGQLGEDFHRSIWRLIAEAFEGLLHFDGRIWRTLPDLFLRPARLTRTYLDGHRAPQIPPLRLFLVTLLLLFFAGSLGSGLKSTTVDATGKSAAGVNRDIVHTLDPTQREEAKRAIAKVNVSLLNKPDAGAGAWLRDRLGRAIDDPQKLELVMEQWSERFAFLMLPMSALMLSLLFVFQRRFFVFDHTIFSLHSLSAAGLILSLSFLVGDVSGGFGGLLLLALPVHLFAHMRGVYRTSILGTLARMFLLAVGSVIGFVVLMLGLIWVGLNAIGAA